MHKRRLIAIAIALMLTLVTTAMWSASTIVREGDSDANFLEDSGATVGVEEARTPRSRRQQVPASSPRRFGRWASSSARMTTSCNG